MADRASGDRVLALAGPTGSGKTAIASSIAAALDAEIVSFDSMAVYRAMDIGTAKPAASRRSAIAHHCIDIVDPDVEFSAADYQPIARAAIDDILSRGRTPLLVGGSGLYLRAAVDDVVFGAPPAPDRRAALEREALADLVDRLTALDAAAAARIDLANRRRVLRAVERALDSVPPAPDDAGWRQRSSIYDLRLVVVSPVDRADLYRRIDTRVDEMIAAGWQEETRSLLDKGPLARTAAAAIGYSQLAAVNAGEMDIDDAVTTIKAKTRAFARRQLTWFRADPRSIWTAPSAADVLRSFGHCE